jgi:ribosomal protein S27E
MLNQKLKVQFICNVCGAVAMEDTVPMSQAGNPITYSKHGLPKFCGKVLPEAMRCPSCSATIVKTTGLHRGVFGRFNMSTV